MNESKLKHKIYKKIGDPPPAIDSLIALTRLKEKLALTFNTQHRLKNHRMPTNASINVQSNLIRDMKAMVF